MSTDESPTRYSTPTADLVGTQRTAWRYRAACMDQMISIACFFCLLGIYKAYLPKTRSIQMDVIAGLFAYVLYLLYYFIPEACFSTTPGKAWFGLCIRQIDGRKCTVWGAFLRTVTRIIELNPLFGALPAMIIAYYSERRQRLGDMLAGTVVVEKRDVG